MRGTLRVVAGAAAVAAVALAVVAVLVSAPWLWVAVAACAVGGVVAAVASRRPSAADHEGAVEPATDGPERSAVLPPARSVDDLQTFFDHPPGSPAALPAAASPAPQPVPEASRPTSADLGSPDAPTSAGSPSVPTTDGDPGRAGGRATADGPGHRRRGPVLLSLVALLVLAGGAVAVVTTSSSPDSTAAGSTTSPTGATSTGPATTPTSPAAPLTAAAAGDLADVDLRPGDDGFTASLTFPGVVLEPRAVGVTVAYPVLTVEGDDTSAIAHLDLPLWNCLAADPPADPVAAQCSRALEEHADLGTPELSVHRRDGRVELDGAFATYTRPNGSAPAYTARSYAVTVTIAEASGPTVTGSLTVGGTAVQATGPGSLSG